MKRLFALVLAGAVMIPTVWGASYSDTSGHWAEGAIEKWSAQYGILQGYSDGSFRPDSTITRGAFAGILVRFLQYQTESPALTFSDTAGEYWESSILKLNAAGVYLGTGGRANLHSNITRQQAIAMIARAFGIEKSSGGLSYADASAVGDYAAGYLSAMAAAGYITDVGSDNRFRPTDAITRAEIVNILNNMIAVLCQVNDTYTGSTDGTLMINAADGASLENMTISGDLIVAPGVSGEVSLTNVTVQGGIRNLGSAVVNQYTTTPTTPTVPTAPVEDHSVGVWPVTPEYTGQTYTYSNVTFPVPVGTRANTLDKNAFSWDAVTGRLCYGGSNFTTRFGIDVASYQGNIDWNAVAADGVQFAMVRLGFRGYGASGAISKDYFYEQNVDGAAAAGIETGVYFFSQAITTAEAVEEANYVIGLLQGHQITGPVMFDWEMKDSSYRVYGTKPEVATACALTFCKLLADAGYRPMIYMGQYVAYVKYGAYFDQISRYPVCYAGYTTANSSVYSPGFYYQPDYWQYSSSGKISGIAGKVDVDLQFISN